MNNMHCLLLRQPIIGICKMLVGYVCYTSYRAVLPTSGIDDGNVCTGPEDVSLRCSCRPLCSLPDQLQRAALTLKIVRKCDFVVKPPAVVGKTM